MLAVPEEIPLAPADVETLADMASRLSWLAYDLCVDLDELDLNPVLALPAGQGAVTVDALTCFYQPDHYANKERLSRRIRISHRIASPPSIGQ